MLVFSCSMSLASRFYHNHKDLISYDPNAFSCFVFGIPLKRIILILHIVLGARFLLGIPILFGACP